MIRATVALLDVYQNICRMIFLLLRLLLYHSHRQTDIMLDSNGSQHNSSLNGANSTPPPSPSAKNEAAENSIYLEIYTFAVLNLSSLVALYIGNYHCMQYINQIHFRYVIIVLLLFGCLVLITTDMKMLHAVETTFVCMMLFCSVFFYYYYFTKVKSDDIATHSKSIGNEIELSDVSDIGKEYGDAIDDYTYKENDNDGGIISKILLSVVNTNSAEPYKVVYNALSQEEDRPDI